MVVATKYIGFYDAPSSLDEARGFALSAKAKMDYIAESLNRAGREVVIVSPSVGTGQLPLQGGARLLNSSTRLILFRSLGARRRAMRAVRIVYARLALLGYLLKETRRAEPVIVYHSLALVELILVARLLRRFRLILEVEEVYQDAVPTSMWKCLLEQHLIRHADGFIFSTGLLDDRLNRRRAPSVVVHGNYNLVVGGRNAPASEERNVVYAGTLEGRKGAAAAIASAEYLDATYHLHIAGFGSPQEVQVIVDQLERINALGGANVSFHGTLVGAEYSALLGSCEVGLATQQSSASFNGTSFPSKILSYLTHGLRVVAPRIPAIESSGVASAVNFYDGDTPNAIADAIRESYGATVTSSSDLLARLDRDFVFSLGLLLASVERSTSR